MTSNHPGSEVLVRLADRDFSPAEAMGIREHIRECAGCREEFASIENALADHDRFHREILKPSLAPPPAEWAALKFPKPRRVRPLHWLAAAASIAVVFLLVRKFESAPEVQASELLRKAAAAERTASPLRARIRIRSGSRTMERAARVNGAENGDAASLHAMFDAAGYSWDDPLSAGAFSRWRDSLAQKRDDARESSGAWLVRTSSEAGALSEGALTLRSSDLHAIECTLRFRATGEIIEMTELPDVENPVQPPAVSQPAPPSPAPMVRSTSALATSSDELHVIAVLHGIGADLGEPIQVERQGPVVLVRVTGLDENRRNQIRTALASMASVDLQFEDLRANGAPAPAPGAPAAVPAEKSNPLIAELQGRLGAAVSTSALTDQLIDATDRASERAFALRSLARRFPPEAAAHLSREDAAMLNTMARDHAEALRQAMEEIRRVLSPILPAASGSTSIPASATISWQTAAESLPSEVEQLDRTANGATDAMAARKAQLAASLARIDGLIRSLPHP
jgi:hypothetical protein